MTYEPRRFWDERARQQGPGYVGPGGHAGKAALQGAAFAEALRRLLKGCRSHDALDFGCGSGRLTAVIEEFTDHYVGVDISPAGLAQAQAAHRHADFRLLPPSGIPLTSASVDLLVAVTVLQHIVAVADWAFWTAELRRVLAPEARVLVIDAVLGVSVQDPHVRSRTIAEIEEALGCRAFHRECTSEHWIWELVNPGAGG